MRCVVRIEFRFPHLPAEASVGVGGLGRDGLAPRTTPPAYVARLAGRFRPFLDAMDVEDLVALSAVPNGVFLFDPV